jgi:hypothetical protein
MELHVPPSGFDFRTAGGPGVNIDPQLDDHSTQRYPLGTRLVYGERWFRYVLVGGSVLVAGNTIGAKAVIGGHTDKAVNTAAKGATSLLVTPSATAITANEYRDGYVNVNDDTGEAYALQILSHLAESSGSAEFTVNLIDPVPVAFAAATTVTLVQSPWGEVIQVAVTTRIGQIVGVAVCPVTAAQFGWVQTHGPCSVLTAGTVVIGNDVVVPTGAAGAMGPRTTALAVKEQVIGRCMTVNASGEHSMVYLTIE